MSTFTRLYYVDRGPSIANDGSRNEPIDESREQSDHESLAQMLQELANDSYRAAELAPFHGTDLSQHDTHPARPHIER